MVCGIRQTGKRNTELTFFQLCGVRPKRMPLKVNTYLRAARLHRPIGIWLTLLPALWGIFLASPGIPPLFLVLLFVCGATFMRSAGCIYNDIIDKDFDAKVRRTASRPFAAGEISLKEAYLVLLFFLMCSAFILFSLPLPVILTGFMALFLIFLYPWMKRLTYWPQFFLGITFNMGLLMGWLSLNPRLSFVPLLFYGGAILWTIGYDTIYALQDKDDDLLAGVKSSAIAVSKAPKLFLSGVYSLSLILWGIGGKEAHLKGMYWLFLSLIAFHFTWQILTLREDDPPNCLKRFQSNTTIGILLLFGIVLSRLLY